MNSQLTAYQLSSSEVKLASQGAAMAQSLLNGGPGLGSFSEEAELSYETAWRPENLPAPFWSDLGSKEQDKLMDAFAEAFKDAMQRPAQSDHATLELLREVREVLGHQHIALKQIVDLGNMNSTIREMLIHMGNKTASLLSRLPS